MIHLTSPKVLGWHSVRRLMIGYRQIERERLSGWETRQFTIAGSLPAGLSPSAGEGAWQRTTGGRAGFTSYDERFRISARRDYEDSESLAVAVQLLGGIKFR